jgi:hypothetical protein
MSKRSKRRAKRASQKPASQAGQPNQATQTNQNGSANQTEQPNQTKQASQTKRSGQTAKKVRGGWLTAALILIIVHGIFTTVLLLTLRKQPGGPPAPWLWAAAILVGLADIAAAALMWYWKRWGLYLYIVATLAGIAVGLVVFPSGITAIHGIIPLGILGFILSSQKKLQLLE